MLMIKLSLLPLVLLVVTAIGNPLFSQMPAPDFTITTSDGQVKKLYQDYISQQKLVVIEGFFTSCPPCATHAPLFQNLYTDMQAAYPGQVEFILLSTLFSDTNLKVAQYKTSKGLTMPGAGNDGGSIAALQPYLNGLFGDFQGTPTFIVIAPGSGTVFFDIRGNTPGQTISLIQQKIEELLPKSCSLEDPFGNALDAVQIQVEAQGFDTSFVADGSYDLSQTTALQNADYHIKPTKSGNTTGLTTYDLVLISKHILALEPLLCPWQLIAADVNCTGSITTFDIVTARQVILGILDSLPCGSWRFMPDSVSASQGTCQNFVGVKLGDVNAGPCNDSLTGISESRTTVQKLHFNEVILQPGETVRVPLFFGKEVTLEGIQFAIDFDPNLVSINSLDPEALESFDQESYHLWKNRLAFSWFHPQGQLLHAYTPFMILELTATRGGRLSELLRLSEADLTPEAYTSEGKAFAFQFEVLNPASSFSIVPNPASERFALYMTVSQAEDCRIQVMDTQGRIILEKSQQVTPGANRLDIALPAKTTGVHLVRVNGMTAGRVVLN